jgi:hypothetical protein
MARDHRARKARQEQRRQAGRRKAGARRPSDDHSSGCTSDPHQVCALTRNAILMTGPRRTRLLFLDIQFLLSHGHQFEGEQWRRQAPPKLGFSYLGKCYIGAAAAAAAARRGEIRSFFRAAGLLRPAAISQARLLA